LVIVRYGLHLLKLRSLNLPLHVSTLYLLGHDLLIFMIDDCFLSQFLHLLVLLGPCFNCSLADCFFGVHFGHLVACDRNF